MDVEVILISELPLPFHKVASWTNMYHYLFKEKTHHFNYIICPEPKEQLNGISYQFLRKINVLDKLKNKIPSKSKYSNYLEAMDKIIQPDKKYVLQIIDNSGIITPIHNHICKTYNRTDFYIQYYFHGFAPIVPSKRGKKFLGSIDELLFLTRLAYKEFLKFYDECPFKARIIHNGIDLMRFKSVNNDQKEALRLREGLSNDEIVFMWCSQDRPKKGLHIILEAFKEVHVKNPKTKLLVAGVNREINQKGVINLKRVPNVDLPKYYQMSDIYLFPTLWKEGFGIVLAEAMHCGSYIIASDQGGVREVLGNGEYGVLIDHPNIVSEWISAMNNGMIEINNKGNKFSSRIPEDLYSLDNWCNTMNQFIEEAKQKLLS
ncbi:glycosyltransferase family 4 protein [Winogradskyella vincentii]|uniref:Glycosyltransferase family 4 protein n=1 Tax=Winogradskyella vincentii TaxID=2877122 RepID=A0ABS7Y1A3_9FLAO|nr:glycosyltransferase family 4 protein [Winogradskyella vincentii]MCA0153715.1 glycosyltransferase family 4 protein [Winogradskyella vincentii]